MMVGKNTDVNKSAIKKAYWNLQALIDIAQTADRYWENYFMGVEDPNDYLITENDEGFLEVGRKIDQAIDAIQDYTHLRARHYRASARKSTEVGKSAMYSVGWCGDKFNDARELCEDCLMSNYTSSNHRMFDQWLKEYNLDGWTLVQILKTMANKCREFEASDNYSASARKSSQNVKKGSLMGYGDDERIIKSIQEVGTKYDEYARSGASNTPGINTALTNVRNSMKELSGRLILLDDELNKGIERRDRILSTMKSKSFNEMVQSVRKSNSSMNSNNF